MKRCQFLAFALLMAAVPGWADEISAPAAPPSEPVAVQATAANEAPAADPDLAIDPFLGLSEVTTSTLAFPCIQCIDEPSHCHGPSGKVCGTGDPPNSCTCQRCNGTVGCFP